jgi:hypothetical protein
VAALRKRSALHVLRELGPYVLVDLLLPGGTLLALVLWLSSGSGRGQLADVHHAGATAVAIERVIDTPPSL